MTNNMTPLLDAWIEAKATEQGANRRRLEIEKEITSALETKKEGAITHEVGGYKVTLTQNLSRKIDVDMWDEVAIHVPHAMAPVKVKYEVDAKKLKYLQNNEPEIWRKIATAFTTTPAKVGVKITMEGEHGN